MKKVKPISEVILKSLERLESKSDRWFIKDYIYITTRSFGSSAINKDPEFRYRIIRNARVDIGFAKENLNDFIKDSLTVHDVIINNQSALLNAVSLFADGTPIDVDTMCEYIPD